MSQAIILSYETLKRHHQKLPNRVKYVPHTQSNFRLAVLERMGFSEHNHYKIRLNSRQTKQIIEQEYWHLKLKHNKIVYFTDSTYLYLYYQ